MLGGVDEKCSNTCEFDVEVAPWPWLAVVTTARLAPAKCLLASRYRIVSLSPHEYHPCPAFDNIHTMEQADESRPSVAVSTDRSAAPRSDEMEQVCSEL